MQILQLRETRTQQKNEELGSIRDAIGRKLSHYVQLACCASFIKILFYA